MLNDNKPKIIEIKNNLSLEEERRNLKNIYDVFNKIGKSLWDKGEDVSEYFYSNNEYEQLKKTGKKELI